MLDGYFHDSPKVRGSSTIFLLCKPVKTPLKKAIRAHVALIIVKPHERRQIGKQLLKRYLARLAHAKPKLSFDQVRRGRNEGNAFASEPIPGEKRARRVDA